MAFPVGKYAFRLMFSPFLKRVSGLEHLPTEGNFLLAANHCSYIDSLLLGTLVARHLNKKLYFLGKKEHFANPLERRFNEWGGMIPINRQAGASGIKRALHELEKGKILVIYPEGTRSRNGQLQNAKPGIAKLALDSGVPVLPVGISGTFDVLPKGKKWPRLAPIEVHIGQPVQYFPDPDCDKRLQRHRITEDIMSNIALLIASSQQERESKALCSTSKKATLQTK